MNLTTTIQKNNSHVIIPTWPAPKHIKAYTSTRLSGFSQAPFGSFNLSLNTSDDPKAVQANRKQLINDLELPAQPFYLKQTHSTICIPSQKIALETSQALNIEADASFTSQTNTVACILTADCLPILVCSRHGDEIAAIHAGWKGLLDGVVESSLSCLKTPLDQLLIWLGPGISQNSFEVEEDIMQAFCAKHPHAQTAFIASQNPNRMMGDLYTITRIRLAALGISMQQIYGGDYCSYTQSQLFYSYRRDKELSGRMASLIWIQD